jgi:hydroxymethylpyrimidine/phosphomethylpyrimidine kinase
VIVKGGHGSGEQVVDLLFENDEFLEFRTPRLETRNTHGTGCTFAAALAAFLAHGCTLPTAARRAQEYVAGAIRHSLAIGHGHGPLDHFWATRTPR